jgi:two-component system, LytTR family, response regulator
MINCVIIDDEKPAREALEMMITRFFPGRAEVIGKAASLKEGVICILKEKPDVVFLDIEMPGEDGFRLFTYFEQVPFSVIFITAYKEYAIKAIKHAALDYLLKPVNVGDLRQAFDLFEKKQLREISGENIRKLAFALTPGFTAVEKIALPTFAGFQMERVNDIMFCQADHNYTEVHLTGGRKVTISKALNVVEDLLPESLFFRIHKSYLVNLNYIKLFSREEGFHVILENGVRLDVAGRRKEEFLKVLTGR